MLYSRQAGAQKKEKRFKFTEKMLANQNLTAKLLISYLITDFNEDIRGEKYENGFRGTLSFTFFCLAKATDRILFAFIIETIFTISAETHRPADSASTGNARGSSNLFF